MVIEAARPIAAVARDLGINEEHSSTSEHVSSGAPTGSAASRRSCSVPGPDVVGVPLSLGRAVLADLGLAGCQPWADKTHR